MRIGELSKRTGTSIQALRFYEREKLLPQPPRTPSGYRAYTDADLQRVLFICDAQALGFTLREIRQLTQIHDPNGSGNDRRNHWPEAFEIARRRLALIDEKIRELQAFRKRLASGLERSNRKSFRTCPASVPPAPQASKRCPQS